MVTKTKVLLSILCINIFLNFGCQKADGPSIEILTSEKLSSVGSTRATAYNMSTKIITADEKVFVTWLDQPADVQIRELNLNTGMWGETVKLGTGVDNHSGAALTMDSGGYLYAAFGPHHGPFQFKKSTRPFDITQWVEAESFGLKATYPSLVCGLNDTLFIAYRSSETDPWRLLFQRRPPQGTWSEPLAVVDASVKDYAHLGNVLVVGQDGSLHLGFHIYDMHPAAGKAAGYLNSRDGGKTWRSSTGAEMTLPVTPASECFFEQGAELDMRVVALALDMNGNPWLTTLHLESSPRTVILWNYDGKNWHSIDLLKFIKPIKPDGEMLSASISIDRDGVIYLVCSVTDPFARDVVFFGHPSQEVYLLTSFDNAEHFEVLKVSQPDPHRPNWLTNIEKPYNPKPIDTPAFLYMHGVAGTTVHCSDSTEVYFVRLKKN